MRNMRNLSKLEGEVDLIIYKKFESKSEWIYM